MPFITPSCFSSLKPSATPISLPKYLSSNSHPCVTPTLSQFLFQVGGAAVLGVGVWTLLEKSDYLSLLASSTFAVSTYILIIAGSLVVVTGFLGCCAVIREQRSCLSTVRQETHRFMTTGSKLRQLHKSFYLNWIWVVASVAWVF